MPRSTDEFRSILFVKTAAVNSTPAAFFFTYTKTCSTSIHTLITSWFKKILIRVKKEDFEKLHWIFAYYRICQSLGLHSATWRRCTPAMSGRALTNRGSLRIRLLEVWIIRDMHRFDRLIRYAEASSHLRICLTFLTCGHAYDAALC